MEDRSYVMWTHSGCPGECLESLAAIRRAPIGETGYREIRRQVVLHRAGQIEPQRHAVYGVRRDYSRALPVRPSDLDGLATHGECAFGYRRVHGFRNGRASALNCLPSEAGAIPVIGRGSW